MTIVRRQNELKRKGTYEIKSLNYRYVFQTPLLYPSINRAIAMPEVVKSQRSFHWNRGLMYITVQREKTANYF